MLREFALSLSMVLVGGFITYLIVRNKLDNKLTNYTPINLFGIVVKIDNRFNIVTITGGFLFLSVINSIIGLVQTLSAEADVSYIYGRIITLALMLLYLVVAMVWLTKTQQKGAFRMIKVYAWLMILESLFLLIYVTPKVVDDYAMSIYGSSGFTLIAGCILLIVTNKTYREKIKEKIPMDISDNT